MKVFYKVPAIEEIYNVYHSETMYAMKGIYPRSIKNFNNVFISLFFLSFIVQIHL